MGTVFDGFIGYTKGVGLKDCFFALGVRGASLAAVSGIACMCIWQFAHMHMGGHVWRACGPVWDFCDGGNRLIREVTRRGAKSCFLYAEGRGGTARASFLFWQGRGRLAPVLFIFWLASPIDNETQSQITGGGALPDSAMALRTSTVRSRRSPTTKKRMMETMAGRRLPVT